MLKCKISFVIIIAVALSGISMGQNANKTGLGIAIIDLLSLFEINTSNELGTHATITIPIITSPGFRVEPEFGYFMASSKATVSGTDREESTSSWRIGMGFFPQKKYEDFFIYYGGRVGYISQKATIEVGTSKDEATTSGFYIAPAMGGEHNFSEHFSIGAEAQVVFASLTNEEDDRAYDVDLTLFDTRGLVFFRFYF